MIQRLSKWLRQMVHPTSRMLDANEVDQHKANGDLHRAEQKLKTTRQKAFQIAQAARTAKRTTYIVDNFTDEIRRSFGGSHG